MNILKGMYISFVIIIKKKAMSDWNKFEINYSQ